MQLLPIPELVPFRLTPQMLGVLAPHDGGELLLPGLAAALAALGGAKQLLGAMLEVRPRGQRVAGGKGLGRGGAATAGARGGEWRTASVPNISVVCAGA